MGGREGRREGGRAEGRCDEPDTQAQTLADTLVGHDVVRHSAPTAYQTVAISLKARYCLRGVCRLRASRPSGLSLLSCRLRARRLRASVFAARCAAMDFLELAALCAGRPAAPAPGFDEPPPPPEGAREAGAVVEPEQDAFMQLALLAARPAEPHKPVQRSHEHALIARSAKARKTVQAEKEQEKDEMIRAQKALAVASTLDGGGATGSEGIAARRLLTNDEVSMLRLHLASAPAQRGSSSRVRAQAIAACRAAATLDRIQNDALRHMFLGAPDPARCIDSSAAGGAAGLGDAMVRVRSLPTQFDESMQRVKYKYDRRRLLSAPKQARAQQSKHIFVQHAEYLLLECREVSEKVVKSPFFLRPRTMEENTADDVTEAFLLNVSLPIEDPVRLRAFLLRLHQEPVRPGRCGPSSHEVAHPPLQVARACDVLASRHCVRESRVRSRERQEHAWQGHCRSTQFLFKAVAPAKRRASLGGERAGPDQEQLL